MRSLHKLGIDRVELRRANLIPAAEMPYTIAVQRARRRGARRSIPAITPGFFDKALTHFRWTEARGRRARRGAPPGELVGAGVAFFLEEAGRGPTRRRPDRHRYQRRGRDRHRRRLGRPGLRDRDGADLRRGARRRLPRHPRRARPDRPHRPRHRRARRARHRADRQRGPCDRRQAARPRPRLCGRAIADAGCRARHRRRRGAKAREVRRSLAGCSFARRSVARGPSIALGDLARRVGPASDLLRGAQSRAHGAGLVYHRPHRVSVRRTFRGGAGRCRHRPRDRRAPDGRL